MLWEFERLFWHPDKVEMAARELREDNEGADEDAAGPPPPPPIERTCRVCGWTGVSELCLTCLAGTMVPARRRR